MSKQISISFVRQIELKPESGEYEVTEFLGQDRTNISYIKGTVDSIYHDGPHRTTFTITFNIEE